MAVCWVDVGPDADARSAQSSPDSDSDMGKGGHIPHLALLDGTQWLGDCLYSLGQRWEGGQETLWLLGQLPAQGIPVSVHLGQS